MSKKQTKTTAKKNRKESAYSGSADLNVFAGVPKRDLLSFSFGFILAIFAIFLLVAFVSYLYTGAVDYDILESTNAEDMVNEDLRFRNVCGSIGAKLAHFFLNRCFGLASFLIIPFLLMLGFRMMSIYRVRLVRKLILGMVLLVWSSVFLAFIASFIPGLEDSFLNLGGNHGNLVVRKTVSVVGTPGLLGLLVITAVLYLVYVSAKTIEYIRSLFRLSFIRKMRNRKHLE